MFASEVLLQKFHIFEEFIAKSVTATSFTLFFDFTTRLHD
jgi:hypothetical protein